MSPTRLPRTNIGKCWTVGKIMVAMRQWTWHVESLVCDKDINRVETFNSVITKFIGGKRINFALSGQYETRVNAAVVAFNTREPVSRLQEAIGTVPTTVQLTVEKKRKITLDTMEQKRREGMIIKKKAARKQYKVDCDYGPRCMKPDATPEELNARIKVHMEMLYEWQKDRENVELKTRNQSTNEQWQYIRTKLLTASKFGEICKMRPQTSCVSKVRAILYPQDLPLEALQYGSENEDKARYQIEEANGLKINKCGLFIDPEIPYL